MAELCDRYLREYAEPRKRASSVRSDRTLINKHILPGIGHLKVAAVTHQQVESLHAQISRRAQIAANWVLALLSKAFALAIKWGLRAELTPAEALAQSRGAARTLSDRA